MTLRLACNKEVDAVSKAVSESNSARTEELENSIVVDLKEMKFKDGDPFFSNLHEYANNLDVFLTAIGAFPNPSKTLKRIISNLTEVQSIALYTTNLYNFTEFTSPDLKEVFLGKLPPWQSVLTVLRASQVACTRFVIPKYKFQTYRIPPPPSSSASAPTSRSVTPSSLPFTPRTLVEGINALPSQPHPMEEKILVQRRGSLGSRTVEKKNPLRRGSFPSIPFREQKTRPTRGYETTNPSQGEKKISVTTVPCPQMDSKTLQRISPVLQSLPWNSEQFLSIARILRYLKDEKGQSYLSPRFTPSQSRFAQKTIVPETRGSYGIRGRLILPSHLYEMVKSSCGNVESFVHALEEIRDRRFRTQSLEEHWNPPKRNQEWETQQELLKKNFTSSNEAKCLQTEEGAIQDLIHLIRFGNLNGTDLHSAVQLLSLETKMRPLPRNIFRVGLLSGDIRSQVDKYRGANNMNPRERKPSLLAELLEQNCTNIPLLNHFIYTNLLTPVQQSQFQTLRGNLK